MVKESACSAGDPGLNPGLGRSPGGGNGNLLQYSCLENFMDRGDWRATDHGIAELDMTATNTRPNLATFHFSKPYSNSFPTVFHIVVFCIFVLSLLF